MPKPLTRKQRIKKEAKQRRFDVQARKVKRLQTNINNLEKRLEKLEEKGGGPN